EGRLKMMVVIAVHRADEADVIDALADVRKQIAHFSAALSAWFKLPERREVFGRLGIACRNGLACVLSKAGFGIEAVHVRHPAGHIKENDALCLAGEMRDFGREGIDFVGASLFREQMRENAGK